jgi:hypothetical protein
LLAVEVSLSLDRAIVFTSRPFQLYANPVAGLKMYWANIANNCNATIVELHHLADKEVGCVHCQSSKVVSIGSFIVR